MKHGFLAAAAACLSMVMAAPASAGTSAEPDVVDVCGKPVSTYDPRAEGIPENALPSLDMCTGWLAPHYDDEGDRLVSVELGVTTDGEAADAPTTSAVHWGWKASSTGCLYELFLYSTSDRPVLMRDCDDRGLRSLDAVLLYRHPRVELDPSTVAVDGGKVTVTLPLDGAPPLLAEALSRGNVLSGVHLATSLSMDRAVTQDTGFDVFWDWAHWESDVEL
jgi:hypothetical protein